MAALIGEEIAKANATLPDVQQVKRYLLLNKELEADDAEMTRTRKVRRRFVAEKYASVIEAFYGGKSSARRHHGDHLRGRPQVDAQLDHRHPRQDGGRAGPSGGVDMSIQFIGPAHSMRCEPPGPRSV